MWKTKHHSYYIIAEGNLIDTIQETGLILAPKACEVVPTESDFAESDESDSEESDMPKSEN